MKVRVMEERSKRKHLEKLHYQEKRDMMSDFEV